MVKIKFHWADIVALIFFLLAIYLILTTIFGNSATPIEVMATVAGGLGFLIYRVNREVGELKVNMRYGFDKVKDSFDKVKEDINVIKEDIGLIKGKLKIKN